MPRCGHRSVKSTCPASDHMAGRLTRVPSKSHQSAPAICLKCNTSRDCARTRPGLHGYTVREYSGASRLKPGFAAHASLWSESAGRTTADDVQKSGIVQGAGICGVLASERLQIGAPESLL